MNSQALNRTLNGCRKAIRHVVQQCLMMVMKVMCGPANELAQLIFSGHIAEGRPIEEQPGHRLELELNKPGHKMELGPGRKEQGPGRMELGQHKIAVEELHSWTWASWPSVRHNCPLVSWLLVL